VDRGRRPARSVEGAGVARREPRLGDPASAFRVFFFPRRLAQPPRRILGDDGRTLGVALTQTGKRSNYLLAPVLLLLIVGCGGKNTSESSAPCKHGCYRGHGVSFNYPPKWQKTSDTTAPISDLWFVDVVRDKKYSNYVEITGQGQSELGFPPANLAAGKAHLKGQREALGAFFQPGSEKLTIDGQPALRFRSTLTNGTGAAAGNTVETAWLLTFKGKTQYRFECNHQARVPDAQAAAAEIERGCAQIVRTFKVED
jgi:hypothetical protein